VFFKTARVLHPPRRGCKKTARSRVEIDLPAHEVRRCILRRLMVERAPKKTSPKKRVSPPAAPVGETLRRLHAAYPDAHCWLDHRSPLELLVATILSAQCTDARVNMVTPELFRRFPDARALADAAPGELEESIKSTGFFNAKAKSIRGAARRLVDAHGGKVPRTMDELRDLPGVGRKTANVVLGNAFGAPDGRNGSM
jgi:endonuclease III